MHACTGRQGKKGGEKSAEENPAQLFWSQTCTKRVCDVRHKEGGQGVQVISRILGQFESLLHNQPSFQVYSELSDSGLFQTTVSE